MTVSRFRVLSSTTLLAGALCACGDPSVGGDGSGPATGGGIGIGGEGAVGGGDTGGTSPGGAPAGGASTGGVGGYCDGVRPAQAYLCAGSVSEAQLLGFNWATLYSEPGYYACGDDYYEYPYPGTGGFIGVGGSTITGGAGGYEYPNPGMGGVGALGEESGEEIGMIAPPQSGGTAGTSTGGIGGWEMGGAAGAETGGTSTGGIGGTPDGSWCSDIGAGTVAGVSYAVGPCTESQLVLPLRFQESDGWYTLRVFAGASPCERGTLIAETAGYGVAGTIVELPAQVEGDQFVSLELTADDPWTGAQLTVQLLPHPAGE